MNGKLSITVARLNYLFHRKEIDAQAISRLDMVRMVSCLKGRCKIYPLWLKWTCRSPMIVTHWHPKRKCINKWGAFTRWRPTWCRNPTTRLAFVTTTGMNLSAWKRICHVSRSDIQALNRFKNNVRTNVGSIMTKGDASLSVQWKRNCLDFVRNWSVKRVINRRNFTRHDLVVFRRIVERIAKSVCRTKNTKSSFSPVRSMCKFMVVCLQKLEKFHQRGLVHRDLKPANIVIPSIPYRPERS